MNLEVLIDMKLTPPNLYRQKGPDMGPWDSTDADGMNGAFSIPLRIGVVANCIVSDGMGWEHVSIHINEKGKQRTPTWNEMCQVKEFFWKDDEVVVQYHPAKDNYVNLHPHVLHLWRRPEGFPTPPKIMV